MFEALDFDYLTTEEGQKFDDSRFDYESKLVAVEAVKADSRVKDCITKLMTKRAKATFYKDPTDWYLYEIAKIFKCYYPEKCSANLSKLDMKKEAQETYSHVKLAKATMEQALSEGNAVLYKQAKHQLQKPFVGSAATSKEDYKKGLVVPMLMSYPNYKIELDYDNPYKRNSKNHKAGAPREIKVFNGYKRMPLIDVWKRYKHCEQVSSGTHTSREAFYIDVDKTFDKGFHKRVNNICHNLGLPMPMISVHNANSHFDLYWFLDDVLSWKTMYMKPIVHNLFKSAFACSKTLFKMADDGCTGYNCKNPFSDKCSIAQEGSKACLEALLLCFFSNGSKRALQQKAMATSSAPAILPIRTRMQVHVSSRHMYVFNKAKSIGFRMMFNNGGTLDELAFRRAIIDLANSEEVKAMTGKDAPLPETEVNTIVDSSAPWIKSHYSEAKYKEALSKHSYSRYSQGDRDMSQTVRKVKSFLKIVECLKLKAKDEALSANKIAAQTGFGKTSVACYLKLFCGKTTPKEEAEYRKAIIERLEASLQFYHRFARGQKISEKYSVEIRHQDAYADLAQQVEQAILDISGSEKLSDMFSITENGALFDEATTIEQRYQYANGPISYSLRYCLPAGVKSIPQWLLSTKNGYAREQDVISVFERQKRNIDDYFLQAA